MYIEMNVPNVDTGVTICRDEATSPEVELDGVIYRRGAV